MKWHSDCFEKRLHKRLHAVLLERVCKPYSLVHIGLASIPKSPSKASTKLGADGRQFSAMRRNRSVIQEALSFSMQPVPLHEHRAARVYSAIQRSCEKISDLRTHRDAQNWGWLR